jgi:chromosome segregation ATPase
MTDLITDLESTGLPTQQVSNPPINPGPNYEAKYKGLQKLQEVQSRELLEAKAKLEQFSGFSEEELTQIRADKAALQRTQEQTKVELEQLRTEKARLEAQLSDYTTQQQVRAKVVTEFPDLVDLLDAGDLRKRSEFETDEKFDEYLNRINSKVTAKTQLAQEQQRVVDKAQGAVQPPTGRNKVAAVVRTVPEIADAMNRLNRSDPEYGQKMALLDAEMNAAVASR